MTPPLLSRASVRVPATSANLGAGFDCVGVAVNRWLRVSAELRPATAHDGDTVTIRRRGTLQELDRSECRDPREDLIWKGFQAVRYGTYGIDGRNGQHFQVRFDATSDIPIARGLGSSAAALLAGAALANVLFDGGLGTGDLARIGADLEGHGDNAGAAAFGGAVLVAPRASRPCFVPLRVHESLGLAFAVPEFETHTDLARAALPAQVSFDTAVGAAARSAALVRGLHTGHRELLMIGLDDVLHVPSRKALVPGFDRVVQAACAAGAFGATLSGSGSSLVAIAPREFAAHVATAMTAAWQAAGVAASAFATGVLEVGLSTQPPQQPSATESPTSRMASPVPVPRNIACP